MRPLEYEEWIINRIGVDAYMNLKLKAREIVKVDYEAVLEDLKSRRAG